MCPRRYNQSCLLDPLLCTLTTISSLANKTTKTGKIAGEEKELKKIRHSFQGPSKEISRIDKSDFRVDVDITEEFWQTGDRNSSIPEWEHIPLGSLEKRR